ncbi:MAG: ferredoxin:protochlorophyllide reductase (ATP-dependent) subunit B [Betaproteobacteria bacterium]|nr:ferredoxin:protochlorophyllide reductase (ATP-dependent) subunit B [Betaproteobacteria bacterium]
MKLAVWTYEGPPHVGAMRVATGMRSLHYVLHAPQGDTYADLLFTMIERRNQRPPVTYTTFQARDLGSDTAALFKRATQEAFDRFAPQAMIVGASCTGELIQDDPAGLALALQLPIPVIPLELPSYQKKENWGAAETFYQLVRHLVKARAQAKPQHVTEPAAESSAEYPAVSSARRPRCNLLGPTALGFRHRDDVKEISGLLNAIGIDVLTVAPLGADPQAISRLVEADFNVLMYPELGLQAAQWLQKNCAQPFTKEIPIGIKGTQRFIDEVAVLAGLDLDPSQIESLSAAARSGWYARSVDSNYLHGKRVFVFGDATHALAAARMASEEIGLQVVGIGTYSREWAREIRSLAERLGAVALISDDYLEVERAIDELQPELVLGTQMERHIAKRLRIPCAVISAPVHVQDYPSRYSPQMGFEGSNVLFDTWIHPLMMGLEEHLLAMFREDFEFHDGQSPSHLGTGATQPQSGSFSASQRQGLAENTVQIDLANGTVAERAIQQSANEPIWEVDAEQELKKIPFFVRGKARKNTELFARNQGLSRITIKTLYDAKAHFAR